MIQFPYNTNDFAFTLSKKFIEFETSEQSYFTVDFLVKHFNFYDTDQNNVILSGGNYKIPIFKGKAIWNIGEKIHRYIANFPKKYQDGLQIKTALVDVTIEERLLTTDALIDTYSFLDLKFIPGPQPKLVENTNALLNINTEPCRVTEKGMCNASFLLSTGSYEIKTFINDQQINTLNVNATAENNCYSVSLNLQEHAVKPADIISFKLENTVLEKQFIVFPYTELSTVIQYVNSFKLISMLELTGGYSFPDKYNQITHKYKRGLEEITEVIETKKEASLKINSGAILKTQLKIIDELLNSKKAVINNLEELEFDLVPVAKKRTGFDTKNFTYTYDLEFLINRTTDAQNS